MRNRIEAPAGRFDGDRARRAVRFFEEALLHTDGRWAGTPFKLDAWQKRDIEAVFGTVDDNGNRVVRTWFMAVPKKNGKSELAAGVALKLLFADDEPAAEIYGAAADREQAEIVFRVAARMARHSRVLKPVATVVDSRKRIVYPDWLGVYQACSAEVGGKHGVKAHGIVFDEVHAQKDHRLWETLTFGSGASRLQPLTFAITTAGVPGESPVAEMLWEEADQVLRGVVPCPPDFYPVVYAAPQGCNEHDEDVWRACNPASFLSWDSVREEYARAKRRPMEWSAFQRYRLNQWVGAEVRAIDAARWQDAETVLDLRELRQMPCWIGVDLSTKLDVTAVVAVFMDANGVYYWLPTFFIPRDNILDRPNIESEKYRLWEKQGFLRSTPGAQVDFSEVERHILDMAAVYDVRSVAYDPWGSTQLAQRLEARGIPVFEHAQGYRGFTETWYEFEGALEAGRIRHGGNPMLTWMADCMRIKGNGHQVKPEKPDRGKSRSRIDGMVAGLMAMTAAVRGIGASVAYYDRGVMEI
jgi:phage terminase large subunit-like protein